MSVNVAAHLDRLAAERPDSVALYWPKGRVQHTGTSPHHQLTFAELAKRVDAVARHLSSNGIQRDTRVAVMIPPGPDFVSVAFALFKLGAVPVMVDPGMGVKNVGACLAEAEPTVFIGIAKATIARYLFGWAKRTVKVSITVGRRVFKERGSFPIVDSKPDDVAAILFTSGSTGLAKGVEYTHGIFAAQVQMLKQTYGMVPGEVDLCTFPLFALFGPALGLTCVIPQMNASRPATTDPHKLVAQLRQFAVTQLFGSPAVLRRLATLHQEPPILSLKRVISAGAPATLPVLEQVTKLLPPGVEIYTPYGATEALPVANVGSSLLLNETRKLTEQGHGVCIGKPVHGVQVHVIRIDDGDIPTWNQDLEVPDGTIGEFVVRGPIVTKRYIVREDATRRAKIVDPSTGEVLHRMGDVGYRDAEGKLWFCGRKSHRVVLEDRTLFTDQVEPVFNHLRFVTGRTALVGVSRAGVVYPVLCYEVGGKHLTLDDHQKALAARAVEFELTRVVTTFLMYDKLEFPTDPRHNSKIFREKLAVWADRRLPKHWKGGPA
jgi:olefin beta-lactone synthetase